MVVYEIFSQNALPLTRTCQGCQAWGACSHGILSRLCKSAPHAREPSLVRCSVATIPRRDYADGSRCTQTGQQYQRYRQLYAEPGPNAAGERQGPRASTPRRGSVRAASLVEASGPGRHLPLHPVRLRLHRPLIVTIHDINWLVNSRYNSTDVLPRLLKGPFALLRVVLLGVAARPCIEPVGESDAGPDIA